MSDHKLVPVEPTEEMLEAGHLLASGADPTETMERCRKAYKAMLEAAPTLKITPETES